VVDPDVNQAALGGLPEVADRLEGRVVALEALLLEMGGQVADLQALVEAIRSELRSKAAQGSSTRANA